MITYILVSYVIMLLWLLISSEAKRVGFIACFKLWLISPIALPLVAIARFIL
jgi:hypothetical protein